MPRIRRGFERIRGTDGGRSLNEDCCCVTEEPLTCTEWENATVRVGVELGYEVGGITINPFFGCSCSGVPLSGIATLGGCAPSVPSQVWCRKYTLGCGNSCVFFLTSIGCSGGIVTVNSSLNGSDCSTPTSGGDFNWVISFRRSFAVAAFSTNTSYDIPRLGSAIGSSSRCTPAGHASATLTLSYTI